METAQRQEPIQEFELEQRLIGKSVERIDAVPKVTGKIVYTKDMTLPFMLYAKVKRSPYPHAKILSADFSRALKIPGVKAVIVGKDFPQLHTEETPALAREVVLYAGQAVAAVAAETRDIAELAVGAIEIEYEELPALLDPLVAMSDNPPSIILHEGVKDQRPNVGKHIHVETGDVDSAFKNADFVLEDEYRTSAETQFSMEPLTFLAKPELGGGLTIWATSSGPHKTQAELSRYLGMNVNSIRAIVPFMGGWFGSKEESHVAAICAMLAIKSSRPVKLELSREETIIGSGTRHPTIIKAKDGISKSGKIVARQVHAVYDGGAYGLLGNVLMKNAAIAAANVYRIPNMRMDAYRVYTNRTPGSPKRAPIGLQIVFAVESHMERVAHELKMDPVRFRELNALENGDMTALGEKIEGINHRKALSEVSLRLLKSPKKSDGEWKTGRGFALGAKWSAGGPYQSSVRMKEDGSVEVWSGVVENGGGTFTALCQIVADEFGVPMEMVRMIPMIFGSDSSVSGIEGGAAVSRQLVNHGKAIMLACEDLKKKIAKRASEHLHLDPKEVVISGGRASSRRHPANFLEISSLFSKLSIVGITKVPVIVDGDELVGNGTWIEELGQLDEKTGQARGGKLSPYYTTVCQGAEVLVNDETGQLKVRKVVAAMDIGKAINPALVHGQIAGSVAMSVGSAVSEEIVMENGRVVNPNLADYKLLTAVDMPEVETIILETPYGEGPLGARGAGEASGLPTTAAIRNAIHDAVGIWINKTPITPSDILLALSKVGQ